MGEEFYCSLRAEGRRVKAQRGWQSKPDMRGRVKEKSLTKRDGRGQEEKRAASPKLLSYIGSYWGKGSGSPAPGRERLKAGGGVRSAGKSPRY